MTKDELFEMLHRGLNEEERAIPLYTKHLESTFFLSDFKPEVRTRIEELLLLLRKESEFHAKIYAGLIKTVEESHQDVY